MSTLYTPTVTLHAGALLGLVFVVLSVLVVVERGRGKVMLGDGQGAAASAPLLVAIRSHANFAEFVPLTLLLIGLIEMQTGPTTRVKIMAGVLVLARALHPIGMRMPSPNPFRAIGFLGTILALAGASVVGLLSVMR